MTDIIDAARKCLDKIDNLTKKDDLGNIEAPRLREVIRDIYDTLCEAALDWWEKE